MIRIYYAAVELTRDPPSVVADKGALCQFCS